MDPSDQTAVVCDDDPVIRHVIGGVLTGCGVRLVGEADTAVRAIDLVEQVRPDIVIVDVAMPGMSGLEAVPVLRRVAPESMVVICSAFELSREAAYEAGAIAVVDKTRLVQLQEFLADHPRPADAGV